MSVDQAVKILRLYKGPVEKSGLKSSCDFRGPDYLCLIPIFIWNVSERSLC